MFEPVENPGWVFNWLLEKTSTFCNIRIYAKMVFPRELEAASKLKF
jgi:hypothetical protein